MIEDPPSAPSTGRASPKTLEGWLEARLKDEERGDIKRLTVPDLYDHFSGDWQKTLEAFNKLEALRAAKRLDDESTRQREGRIS